MRRAPAIACGVLAGLVSLATPTHAQADPVPVEPSTDGEAEEKPADPNANCVCPPQDLKSRSGAKHVFIGKVVEKNDNPKHEGEAMPANAEYRFEIIEWFKNKLPDPILVRTFSVTCSTEFEMGETYVIFGNRNEYQQMTASYCSGNRVATPEVIAELRKILPGSATNGKRPANGSGDSTGKGSGSSKGSGGASAGGANASGGGGLSTPMLVGIGGGAVLVLVIAFMLLRRKRD